MHQKARCLMRAETEPQIETGPKAGATIRVGLKLALVAQVLVAGLVLLTDVDHRWSLERTIDLAAPQPTGPVAPGDQVRRHEPSRVVPRFADPGGAPWITLPEALPARLTFSVEDAADYGPVLLLNGPIVAGDADRFEAFVSGLAVVPTQVALNSPGGIVDEALTIGRSLRAREMTTMIVPGTACMSACPYILAGGSERRVSLRGLVGLHQHYYDTPGYMPVFFAVEDIQHNQARTMEYLIEMGVDPGIMRFGLSTPPDDIYILVEEELVESRLASFILS